MRYFGGFYVDIVGGMENALKLKHVFGTAPVANGVAPAPTNKKKTQEKAQDY